MYEVFENYESNQCDTIPDVASVTDALALPPVEFSSETDATLYTVSTTSPPSSVAEQDAALLLEIRNLLLILLLFIVTFKLYSSLKNTFLSFFGR